jgi:hypothetical protein
MVVFMKGQSTVSNLFGNPTNRDLRNYPMRIQCPTNVYYDYATDDIIIDVDDDKTMRVSRAGV